jgi:hypothetical protein
LTDDSKVDFAAIEVNDAGATIATERGILCESPGYALLEQSHLRIGDEAERRSRLQPRLVHDRFWEQLSSEHLPRPLLPTMRVADLAAAHLSHLWEFVRAQTDRLVLAVPASFTKSQLGLLLGIAARLSLPVAGLVDAATAAIDGSYPERKLLHIDLQLHRVVITGLEQRDGYLSRKTAHSIEGVGLKALLDAWIHMIADQFVKETRFDPLYRAESEQLLYNRLPEWLHALASQSRTDIELTARDGTAYTITLTREDVAQAVQGSYRRILDQVLACGGANPVTLQVSHRLAALPDYLQMLATANDYDIVVLPRGAPALGALKHAQFIANSGTPNTHTTSLPVPSSARLEAQAEAQLLPTHVVYRGYAYALGEEPFWLGTDLPPQANGIRVKEAKSANPLLRCVITSSADGVMFDVHNGESVFLNERPVRGRLRLTVGDSLMLGQSVAAVQMIRLTERDETKNR